MAKLNDSLDSGTTDTPATREGTLFTATTTEDIRATDGSRAAPAGSILRGRVEEVKHVINRTSMKLSFYEIVLPGGRHVPIVASPKPGSKVNMGELKEGGTKVAKNFIIEKGIDAVTAGVFAPIWVAKKVMMGYEFVTKEDRMVLPAGSVIEVRLNAPSFLPRR